MLWLLPELTLELASVCGIHRVAKNGHQILSRWNEIATKILVTSEYTLAHTLVQNVKEHIAAKRIPEQSIRLVNEWERSFAGDFVRIADERFTGKDLPAATDILLHARRLFKEVGDIKSEAQVLLKLGASLSDIEQPEKLIVELENKLERLLAEGLVDEVVQLYINLGDVYCYKGSNNTLAIERYSAALDLDPEQAEAYASRGEVYRQMGQYEAALADLSRAIEIDPEYDWALAHRGEVYWQMDQYEAALADLSRAIEINPKYDFALATRGEVYRQMGQYEAALADLNRAIEIDPKYGWALANRGAVYRQMGQYEAALADLNRAIELKPDSDWRAPRSAAR